MRALYQDEGARDFYFLKLVSVIQSILGEAENAEDEVIAFIAKLAEDTQVTRFDIAATEEQFNTIKALIADTLDELFGENESSYLIFFLVF